MVGDMVKEKKNRFNCWPGRKIWGLMDAPNVTKDLISTVITTIKGAQHSNSPLTGYEMRYQH